MPVIIQRLLVICHTLIDVSLQFNLNMGYQSAQNQEGKIWAAAMMEYRRTVRLSWQMERLQKYHAMTENMNNEEPRWMKSGHFII